MYRFDIRYILYDRSLVQWKMVVTKSYISILEKTDNYLSIKYLLNRSTAQEVGRTVGYDIVLRDIYSYILIQSNVSLIPNSNFGKTFKTKQNLVVGIVLMDNYITVSSNSYRDTVTGLNYYIFRSGLKTMSFQICFINFGSFKFYKIRNYFLNFKNTMYFF